MDSIISKFSDTQFFWLLVFLIIMTCEILRTVFNLLLKPLQVWMRAQNRKALRDKFAAHALSGLIVHDHSPEQNGKEVVTINDICCDAYRYADEMMKVRKEASNG